MTFVTDRVRLHHAGVTQLSGPYDLVLVLEALHDMTDPSAAPADARAALARRATVLIADEKVADGFTAPGDEVERMMYGWSVSRCDWLL